MSLATTETRPPYLVVRSQPDKVKEAVKYWQHSEGNRFDFCVMAAEIVGNYAPGETVRLANEISRSVSSVQNYAKVGELWQAMNPQDAEHYRDAVLYSFWPPVAGLWKANVMDMVSVKSWFDEVAKGKIKTVEEFRNILPTKTNKSIWKASARRWMKEVKKIIDNDLTHSPAFDVDPQDYKQIRRALVVASKRIERAAQKWNEQ